MHQKQSKLTRASLSSLSLLPLSLSLQVTCSSSSSVWTTATLSRRCSGSSGRSSRPSRVWKTRSRRTSTCRWSSAGTRATESFTGRCSRRRSSSWWPGTRSARTSRSPPSATRTWTRCFRLCSPWPSYLTKWAPTSTGKCPCSTATCCTESPWKTRRWRTLGKRTAWSPRAPGDPACTATWCTSRRRRSEAVRAKTKRDAWSAKRTAGRELNTDLWKGDWAPVLQLWEATCAAGCRSGGAETPSSRRRRRALTQRRVQRTLTGHTSPLKAPNKKKKKKKQHKTKTLPTRHVRMSACPVSQSQMCDVAS